MSQVLNLAEGSSELMPSMKSLITKSYICFLATQDLELTSGQTIYVPAHTGIHHS